MPQQRVPSAPAGNRSTHVARMAHLLHSRHSVLVLGGAGVGKTYLVTRALAHLADAPGPERPVVVTISGTAGRRTVPLAALEPLLAEDDTLLTVGAFARTVALRAAGLQARGGEQPVVVRVEDAHLLDEQSAQALAWLVRQGEILMVATARSGAASGSPWHALWKDEVVERIDVLPFTPAELDELLTAELGGPLTADSARRLWNETRGNAFHVREIVAAELDAGHLTNRDGVWVWHGATTVSPRVLDVVAHELDRLGTHERAALELTALAGPVPLADLLDLVPRAAFDELVLLGLLGTTTRPSASGILVMVEVPHSLYAEAIRAGISQERRRVLLAQADRWQAGENETGAALLRSVSTALDSGLPVAPDRVHRAVDAALVLMDPRAAERLATVALDLPTVTDPTVTDAVRAALLLGRAEAWRHLDEPGRALRDLEECLTLLRRAETIDAGVVAGVTRASLIHASVAQYLEGDVDAALAVVSRTSAWLTRCAPAELSASAVRVLEVSRLARLGYAGRHDEAGAESRALLSGSDNHSEVLRLVMPTVIGMAQQGLFDEGDAVCRRYAPVALAHTDTYRWGPSDIATAWFLSRLWSGEVDAAEGMHLAGEDSAGEGRAGGAVDWVVAHLRRGLVAAARGVWSTARTELHTAKARFELNDHGGVIAYVQVLEAWTTAARGDVEQARVLLDRARSTPLRSAGAVEPEIRLITLDALLWMRDPSTRAAAEELVTWARSKRFHRTELEALHRLHLIAQSGPGTQDPDRSTRVAELAARVDGPRAQALARHVLALGSDDADLVRIAERDLGRCGLWLPPASAPVWLTRREQEIAALAAGGMTSRAIAVRLTLSVRTVDSHLARVFTKLGVHSRDGLADALR